MSGQPAPVRLVPARVHAQSASGAGIVRMDNDTDPRSVALGGVARIDLFFPKFTDGRAYSQAFLLRRRLGFAGEIRATGDVLVDQLVQLHRAGFDSAVLRQEADPAVITRQFVRYPAFYQGDALTPAPLFARRAA